MPVRIRRMWGNSARVTNVAGDERRRCLACYERDMALANDLWSN